MACRRGRGSGCSRPGYGINPLGGGHHLTPLLSCQNIHRTGKQTLGAHKQNLVCNKTQEKGAVTTQETDTGLPVSVQESLVEVRVGGSLLQGWGTSAAWGLVKEVNIVSITSSRVWPQVKQQGGNTALPINRKLD